MSSPPVHATEEQSASSIRASARALRRVMRSMRLGIGATELVQVLQRALQGRESGSPGVEDAAARLLADRASLAPIVTELLLSESSARRNALPLLARLQPALQSVQCISLGTHCFSASLLQRWGLRRGAGPFDWVFSSVPMLVHCIGDDFRTFLDRRHYEPVPIEHRPHGAQVNRVQHRFYREHFGVDFVFNHHDVHEQMGHAYLQRSVTRFTAALASESPIVLLALCSIGSATLSELQSLTRVLEPRCRHFLTVAVRVAPATHSEQRIGPTAIALDTNNAHLKVYDFAPMSNWGPLHFDDVIDEHLLIRILGHEAAGLMKLCAQG